MAKADKAPLFDRELSWLSFNERVLQEAADPSVPLLERLKFLAIYSSNLDEFFRVRVASIRSLLRLGSGSQKKLEFNPSKVLKKIHRTVVDQQEEFGRIFGSEILPALRREGIHLQDKGYLGLPKTESLRETFFSMVLPHLNPRLVKTASKGPFLENRGLYLVNELWPDDEGVGIAAKDPEYGIVEIPTKTLPRFLVVESEDAARQVVFLDDVIRSFLDVVFSEFETGDAYSIKMTRDAELYLNEEEFEGDLVRAIEKSLKKRETGLPTRLLFDPRAPYPMITALKTALQLEEDDLVVGGVYHNFSDFFDFPDFGRDDLRYQPLPEIRHPAFKEDKDIWTVIDEGDQLIHVPYQSFRPVVEFFSSAADDDDVAAVYATLYRVSDASQIVEALIRAAKKGKKVTVFVEVKARFDEAPNIDWARRMEDAGVHVLYSRPKIKVHAKIGLVERKGDDTRAYAYLGTGNFNEKTARVYSDLGLFTSDVRLTQDVRRVFELLEDMDAPPPPFDHLLVAPHGLRKALTGLIRREVEHAEGGRSAGITLKLNSIEDPKLIRRLYKASRAGVDIQMIVRGICRLVPGVKRFSENVRVTSIVDRYLEHARIYRFENGGDRAYYLASADWMRRNLDHRVEVAFPIYDERLRGLLDEILDLQLRDDQRARAIDEKQTNPRVPTSDGIRSQMETYRMLAALSGLTESGPAP